MTRNVLVVCLFGAGLVSGVIFLAVTDATVIPMVARGTGPDGVHVTIGGWVAWGLSVLSTGGFTTAGLITFLMGRFGGALRQPTSKSAGADVIELTASFIALMNDRANRAVQRRFFFALVDAANLIQGCETSHEAGIVTIRYQGYADPVTPSQRKGAE